ncbi:ATP-binding protein [Pseudomonas moraviensis]|uniref:nSTAND3 domain-containing NTPase n=1 Tax=Pseudomonas moraviensis TaxID=321662 RepID=UPI000F799E97|nr:ATP-binding protein [Pseudomonas moraviensis]
MNKIAKGAPGYDGYEYQIEISIWVALELMLKKKVSEVLYVEPENSEDIEVLLSTRNNCSENNPIEIERILIQCKSRAVGLWNTGDFKNIVGDGSANKVSTRGPAPRARALQLLLTQPNTAYYFLTNVWVEARLQEFTQSDLNESPVTPEVPTDFLIPELRDQASKLKGRVRIIQGLSRELIGYRTEKLLAGAGKVPYLKINDCVSALVADFRDRLLGMRQPLFTLEDLNKIIASQGGKSQAASSREYYPPINVDEIFERLMSRNVLLITGPPGVGKTLFAEYLTHLLEQHSYPFSIIHERDSVSNIRNRMAEHGPALFVISDPWGTTINDSPTSLSHELVNLVGHASSDKKIIITTRSDLFGRAQNSNKLFLTDYIVEITSESYSEETLWNIATEGLGKIEGGLQVAERNKLEISRELTTPYELSAFNLLLKNEIKKHSISIDEEWAWLGKFNAKWMIDGKELDEREKIDTIIERAASETTVESTTLVLQGWGSHSVEHTAICWLLLVAQGTVERTHLIEDLLQVAEDSPNDLSPERFIEFLCDSHIVRENDGYIYAHSHQREGMAKFVHQNQKAAILGLTLASEYLLSTMDKRGFSSVGSSYIGAITTCLSFYRSITPFKKLILAVDSALERQCKLSRGIDFYETAELAMWWGYGQTNFMKVLNCFGVSRLERNLNWFPNYSEDDLAAVLMDRSLVQYLIPRIITEYLPYTNVSYKSYVKEFVELVASFGVDLESKCRSALDEIYDRMHVDYGDGLWQDQDIDVNVAPLISLLAHYSTVPYANKYTSPNTDLYNHYR